MLLIHTILFPTDFSENAQQAFQLACGLARGCGARIVVLYVMPAPLGHEQIQAHDDPDEYFGDAENALSTKSKRPITTFGSSIGSKRATLPR
jgi:nucleotide-binding universal stress UspA family protein